MTDSDLNRFFEAQDAVLSCVERELLSGKKQTHWMWFIFPQIAGLGHSETSEHFSITGRDQARRYLADPVLGGRLRLHVQMAPRHRSKSAYEIFGTPDDLKLKSCLTLFAVTAVTDEDRLLFREALEQFYGGAIDARTLEFLGSGEQ